MTHRITPLLLAFGGALLAVGLALSVSATPVLSATYTYSADTTTCADCHTTPHTNWQIAPHAVELTVPDLSATPTCSGCHTNLQTSMLAAEHTVILPPEVRLLALRGQLTQVYDAHPNWETAPVQTNEQVLAAQANALLSLIEADTNWGFHSSAYIQTQLDEAEALLHMLTAFSN